MVIRHHNRERKKKKKYDRIDIFAILVYAFAAIICIRLSDIQIFQHSFYEALAANQHELREKLIPKRGEIFVKDKNNPEKVYPVAANKVYYLVYAEPKRIDDPEAVAKEIFSVLEVEDDEEKEEIISRLKKENDLYEPIQHQVEKEKIDQIENLGLKGIKWEEEYKRVYPDNNIASHVLGFVGFIGDKKSGQYGIEEYWDEELAGEMGYLQAEKDARGRWITFGTKLLKEARDGDNLVLTLDRTIEYEACTALDKAVEDNLADGGSIVILNPKTSAVVAMCGSPDFNPNEYNKVEDENVYINPSTFYIYEPGSVFKAITMAAALDQDAVTPTTTYEDKGFVKIGKYTIKNSDGKSHGVVNMTTVLEESLNTGAIFAAEQIGPETFEKYVKRFGFGKAYGIRLNTEANGNISALAKHKEIYMATASFGQGISVTPLQMTNAFAAIANGGLLMQPYIVEEIRKPDGVVIKTEPREIRRVISTRAATALGAMLVNVVREGHGKRAGVAGYYVAGKTGTAQIARKDGPGYEPNLTIGSFCGFAPVNNPVFVMCVKIDKPRTVQWAESTAAPVFGQLAKFILNYYNIPPDQAIE